jgi:hypothetical protein
LRAKTRSSFVQQPQAALDVAPRLARDKTRFRVELGQRRAGPFINELVEAKNDDYQTYAAFCSANYVYQFLKHELGDLLHSL